MSDDRLTHIVVSKPENFEDEDWDTVASEVIDGIRESTGWNA